jgi:hypothetical protein
MALDNFDLAHIACGRALIRLSETSEGDLENDPELWAQLYRENEAAVVGQMGQRKAG